MPAHGGQTRKMLRLTSKRRRVSDHFYFQRFHLSLSAIDKPAHGFIDVVQNPLCSESTVPRDRRSKRAERPHGDD